MKIAIPIAHEQVADLADNCDQLALVDVELAEQQILGSCRSGPVPQVVEELVEWLESEGTDLVIARKASTVVRDSLDAHGIRWVLVPTAETPHGVVRSFLAREIDGQTENG
jgi:predicted Fe-Mo cluster-binding NifX family protein